MNSWLISSAHNSRVLGDGFISVVDDQKEFILHRSICFELHHFVLGGWFIQTGYWQLRDCFVNEFSKYSNEEVIEYLLINHPSDFPKMLKGIFTLVIFYNGKFHVLNDSLGLSRIYFSNNETFFLANSIHILRKFGCCQKMDRKSYISRLQFGRDVSDIMPFADVSKTIWGEYWTLELPIKRECYFHPMSLYNEEIKFNDIEVFRNLLIRNLDEFEKRSGLCRHAVTLTGGKDARTALALLSLETRQVVGLTYGNVNSKDVIYSKKLSNFENLEHFIVDGSNWSSRDILKIWRELFCLDSASISHHRAIRFFALNELYNLNGPCSIWSGYMGGEWLMGIYKDGLVFKDWLMKWVESGMDWTQLFHMEDGVPMDLLSSFSFPEGWYNSRRRREFAVMCEIGIKHHQQDIEIATLLGLTPQPFMLDVDWLKMIFESRFSFVHQNNQTRNLLKRWSLYELNVKLQSILRPEWNDIVFGKKGNYTPRDFLRGPLIWSLKKSLNYFMDNQKFKSSFSYGQEWNLATSEILLKMLEDSNFNFFTMSEKQDLLRQFTQYSSEHYSQEKTYQNLYPAISLYLLFERHNGNFL